MNQGPFINAPFNMIYDRLEDLSKNHFMPEIYFDGNTLDTRVLREYKTVAKWMEEHQLACTFHAPFEDIRPASFDNRIREISMKRLLDTCHLASLFQPGSIVCHTGYWKWIHYEKLEDWIARSVESWTTICDTALSNGTRIMLENVFDDTPEVLARLVKEIGPEKVGICLDIGHLTCFTQCPVEEWLDTLGPYIGELHLHDNHGIFDDHLVMGRGSIDFNPLFQYIKDHELHPIYTLEQHREEDIVPNLQALQAFREKFGV